MNDLEVNAICNTLAIQRNNALDEVAKREVKIAVLTKQIQELTERIAQLNMPKQPEEPTNDSSNPAV